MIQYYNVKKTYRSGVEALKGVSFEIETGEFVFIIGKSGSGKSTLLKCMTKEEDPTEGKVTIDNFDITHMSRALIPTLRRNIGMIYQDFRLIETKTVEENIAFVGEVVGIPKKQLAQSVKLVLSVVGLKEKAHTYPQELSGGEQQRVAIARAMVNNPKLIVADEPTGNLDPETSESIMALLLEINKSGTTVIVCTHDSNMVDRMKKRVIEVEGGRIVRDEYASGYSQEEEVKPTPITAQQMIDAGMDIPTGISFGDDPAFEPDRDYGDDYDDEQYVRQQTAPATVAPMPVVFGESAAEPEPEIVPAAPEVPEQPQVTPLFNMDEPEEIAEEIIPEQAPSPVEEVEEPVPEMVEQTPEPLIPDHNPEPPIPDHNPEPSAQKAPTRAEVKEAKRRAKEAEKLAKQKAKEAGQIARFEKKNKVRKPSVQLPDLDILEDDDE